VTTIWPFITTGFSSIAPTPGWRREQSLTGELDHVVHAQLEWRMSAEYSSGRKLLVRARSISPFASWAISPRSSDRTRG